MPLTLKDHIYIFYLGTQFEITTPAWLLKLTYALGYKI